MTRRCRPGSKPRIPRRRGRMKNKQRLAWRAILHASFIETAEAFRRNLHRALILNIPEPTDSGW